MSNVSTFGTFTMARLGIYASHKAIDIVGNNISNINTEGYTRQSIDQISLNMGSADRNMSMMDTRVGSGAFVLGVTQMRDQYLDIRYRTEVNHVGAMEARDSGLTEIQRIIDEVGKGDDGEGVLEARFNDMIQMMENLVARGAGKDEFDTLFRSACSNVVDTIHAYSSALNVAESNLKERFEQDVLQVNTTLDRIQELNVSIRKAQVYGGNALELQDERNLLLDELSKYINVNITTEKEYLGEKLYVDKLVVRTSDEPNRVLVDGIYTGHLSVRQVDDGKGGTIDSPTLQLDISALKNPNGRPLVYTIEDQGVQEFTARDYVRLEGTEVPRTWKLDDEGKAAAEQMANELNTAAKTEAEAAGEEAAAKQYRVVTAMLNPDGEGEKEYYAIQEFSKAPYTGDGAKEAAEKALEALKADKDVATEPPENPNGKGEKMYYDYRIVTTSGEDGPAYEIHRFLTFKGEVRIGDQELTGSFQEQREILTKQGVFATAEELKDDPSANAKRGIPFYRKSLDVLANSLATLVNKVNIDAFKSAHPNWEAEGLRLPVLFSNDGTADTTTDPEPINASNISISKSWANGSFMVQSSSGEQEGVTQSTANDNLARLLSLLQNDVRFTPQGAVLRQEDGTWALPDGSTAINTDANSKDIFFTGSFQKLFGNYMNGSLGQDINMTETMLKSYESVAEDLFVNRDGVMGVDLNDEAMNMMMFEKSYSAACRLMTTYDEMLDKLINGTAL